MWAAFKPRPSDNQVLRWLPLEQGAKKDTIHDCEMKEAQETATQRRTLKHRARFMLVRGIKCRRDLTVAVKKAGRLKTAFQEINQIPGRSTGGKNPLFHVHNYYVTN